MKIKPLPLLAMVCMAAAAIGLLALIAKNNNAGQRDFITYWAAGQQLVHGKDPYDFASVLPLEQSAGFNRDRALVMRNPPIAFFLTLPLGFVSPNVGVLLWLITLLVCLVVSIRMIWRMNGRPDSRLHLLGYCFAPLMECLMAGQLGIFLLLGMTLFLYFHKTRPTLAGAWLLLCVLKPHLFVPFGIVLILWSVTNKTYRILSGVVIALCASCALAFLVDLHAWSQYQQMLRTSGIMKEVVPTLSEMLRQLINRDSVWIQFIPEACGSLWAVWYFTTRRAHWDWMDQGLLVLLVSVMCSPYSLLTDETVLLPAILAGVYRAERGGRSLIPFGIIAGIAMLEVFLNITMVTGYYLWTTPAWLAWYLYATSGKGANASDAGSAAAVPAE